MRISLLFTAVALSLAACGGGSATETTTTTTTTTTETTTAGAEGPLVPIGEAQIGDRSTCPVSGEEFVVSESSPTVEHEGRTYYFCCPGCAERFRANPQQFLSPPAADTETDASSEG